jgi:hypothetical protein
MTVGTLNTHRKSDREQFLEKPIADHCPESHLNKGTKLWIGFALDIISASAFQSDCRQQRNHMDRRVKSSWKPGEVALPLPLLLCLIIARSLRHSFGSARCCVAITGGCCPILYIPCNCLRPPSKPHLLAAAVTTASA